MRKILALALLGTVVAMPALAGEDNWTTIQRGLYLTRAGDCTACHTADPGKPMAGNYALSTPFGTIYTANLTPDADTGIGNWTADDFYKAMTTGRERDGTRLYPAFPYTHFTILKREDSDAIFAYLKTLKPFTQRVPDPEFPWPLSIRFAMIGWNMLNFEPHAFKPDDDKPADWNRGKYLVEGLAHCGMCHSPKNFIGAEKDGDVRFTGGEVEGWWAPSLTSDKRDGIGDWTKDDLVGYLKYGRNGKSAAFGPMSDVIEHSTRYLRDEDLQAIATYIKSLPAQKDDEDQSGTTTNDADNDVGAEIYAAQCSACHAPDGKGVPDMFGAVKGSGIAQASNPRTLLRLILEGGRSAPTDKYPTPHAMPSFAAKLTDGEIAAVATYVRNAFGNRGSEVGADDVAPLRKISAQAEAQPTK